MTNPTGGFGLRPVRRNDGAAPSWQLMEVEIAYNEGDVIAFGDLVQWVNTGYINLYAAAQTHCAGVFMGCKYRDPNLGYTVNRPMWNAISGLASTDKVKAYIIADPNVVFEIRADDTTAVTVGNIGNTAEIVVGTPSAANGQSVALLDKSDLGTTTTRPLRVVGLGQEIGNDNTLANNVVEVVLNTLAPWHIPPINTL